MTEAIAIFEMANLKKGIGHVSHAYARENTRPVLTTISCLFQDDGMMEMAAADGFRLAVAKVPYTGLVRAGAQLLIPGKFLDGLSPNRHKGLVELFATSHAPYTLTFQLGKAMATTQSMGDASYPNYHILIPTSFNTRVTWEPKTVFQLVKTLIPFARKEHDAIYMEVQEDTLFLWTTVEGQVQGKVSVAVKAERLPGRVAVNGDYLMAALLQKPISMAFSSPHQPVVFTGFGLEVLMPMFV